MDWYIKNRDRILALKKLQYTTNPILREKKKQAALDRYYRIKADVKTSEIKAQMV